MAWGFFKKIKNAFKKAGDWVKNKVIKPVVNTAKKVFTPDNIKKIIDTGMKLAPAIGGAVAASQGAPPQAGMAIGKAVQGVGNNLGYG